ncbi:MAG: hypothetical protein RBG13Loki_2985 [Promethearchaeota archaeon CR_4]|nr:MAG: hypothetical protein RBG13Loki_2985 [Candidatus Lokiarchaeota archaeon CR_4]
MRKDVGYKVKVSHSLPEHPVIVICLPGDGYVGKFCAESLKTNTAAEVAVTFYPFDFPPRVTVEKGTLVIQGFQFYIGRINCRDLVIVTTDLKIFEVNVILSVCGQLAKYIKDLAPQEVLILDACVPVKDFRGNSITQILVNTPPVELWKEKIEAFSQTKVNKDKFFLMLAVALKREQVPARGIICETSGMDIDPEGAKKLLATLQGHPAFPVQFDHQKMETLASRIRRDLEKLVESEQEKSREENNKKKQDNSKLHYIQ